MSEGWVELSGKTMHDMASQTITLDQLTVRTAEQTVQQFKLGDIR